MYGHIPERSSIPKKSPSRVLFLKLHNTLQHGNGILTWKLFDPCVNVLLGETGAVLI